MKPALTLVLLLLLPIISVGQESLWKAFIDAGSRAYGRGDYDDAERRLMLALKEAQTFGPQDSRLGLTYCHLALVHLGKKEMPEAKTYSTKAREILQTSDWSKGSPRYRTQTANLLVTVATGFLGKENDEVEQLVSQALKVQRSALKDDDAAIATTLKYLAITNFLQSRKGNDAASQQKLAEARNHVSEAFTIYEKTSDFVDHKDFIETLRYFAFIDPTKAESILKRALAFREQNKEPEHLDLEVLTALCSFYNDRASFREAEQIARQRLEITERTYGKDDYKLGPALDELGLALTYQDRYSEAEPFLKRAVLVRDTQKLNSEDLAESLNVLAKNYYYQGRYSEAVELYERAIEVAQKLIKKSPENLARYKKNYALLLYAVGRDADAEPLFQAYITSNIERNVALVLYEKAELYLTQKKYVQAEPLFVDSLKKMKTSGINSHTHADALEKFASLLRQTNRSSEATMREDEAKRLRTAAANNNQ